MQIGQAVLLGIIQGLTEFLPVSSSGHLVLAQTILGVKDQGVAFEVFVHFGTLLAVLTIFFTDVINLLKAFIMFISSPFGMSEQYKNNRDLRLLVYLFIASLPAVIVGFVFKESIEAAFEDPRLVCIALIVTALILFATFFVRRSGRPLNLSNTFTMGLAQALAIVPGISRSGSTIGFGLFLKISGDSAARFSFLLAIPAILGATVLEGSDLFTEGIDASYLIPLIAGTAAAYMSGYIAIESLLKIVRKGKLYWFAPYCLLLGVIGLIYI